MKHIIVFEAQPFRQKFIQEILESDGHKVYLLDDPSHSDYMISDIDPDLILYSQESLSKYWQTFISTYRDRLILSFGGAETPAGSHLPSPFSVSSLRSAVSNCLASKKEDV